MCCFLNRSISKRKILLTQLYAPIPRGRGIRELVGGDKVRRTRRFPLVWRKPERDHRYSALVQGVYHEDRVRAGNCCGLNGYTGSLTQNPEWIITNCLQGAFDRKTSLKATITVFALSLMTSSTFIYNLDENIQEDDLQHLQFFTNYGKLALDESGDAPFQKLVFLIRDWQFPYEKTFGVEGGKQLLDSTLKVV